MYYTYVLKSETDGKFYTGHTKDLKLRPALLNSAYHNLLSVCQHCRRKYI
ncbi:MAG TPA: GIY-YIG nuclease family protein [Thermodesulfobacteriota bacterium]|nr:GIY-YIG nuclease family protein [Thermodesulfobacteriota bacterium]